ncbi:MAG: hypothetical protein ACPIOQ_27910, partial [Promethearchaeia archaeon]
VSNQHSFVLFALPAAVLALMRSCRVAKATGEGAREAVAEFGPKAWATGRMSLLETHTLARLVVACAAGLSPYLYVMWAARDPPLSSWGETHTLQGFITHFFRREYGTFAVLPVAGGSPTREGVVLAQATMLEYLRAFAANLRYGKSLHPKPKPETRNLRAFAPNLAYMIAHSRRAYSTSIYERPRHSIHPKP